MKSLIAFGVLSLGLITSANALELNVTNKSKTAIHHLYLSASSQKNWGPDQLGMVWTITERMLEKCAK